MCKRTLISLAEQTLPHAIAHAEHWAELLSSVLASLRIELVRRVHPWSEPEITLPASQKRFRRAWSRRRSY